MALSQDVAKSAMREAVSAVLAEVDSDRPLVVNTDGAMITSLSRLEGTPGIVWALTYVLISEDAAKLTDIHEAMSERFSS